MPAIPVRVVLRQYIPAFFPIANRNVNGFALFLTLNSPQKANEYGNRFAGSFPYVLNEDVLRFYGVSDNTIFPLSSRLPTAM